MASEFTDLATWRWVLTDVGGGTIADHEVRLDRASWQFEAFGDLARYLSWHVAPDRLRQDQATVVADLGQWIGAAIFGPVAAAMVAASPATVQVVVPTGARELLARPLELAHVGGVPLAAQNVTLVMDTGPASGEAEPVGVRLRVLGLFSLPEGGQALSLRRDRQSLAGLIEDVGAMGKAADVRVLQYGVTRNRLRDVLTDAEGWDIVHVSGHGSPGQFLLETDDGKPERVNAAQLAELLAPARRRLKLITLSACWSAAAAIAEQRQLLELPASAAASTPPDGEPDDAAPAPGSLAAELAARLGCAVLAMRYPVDDEFAITLSQRLYALLAGAGHPLPRALGLALRELGFRTASTGSSGEFLALSLAAPALFGGSAVALRLPAPEGAPVTADGALARKLAGLPPQADRFVGRTAVMGRASAVLAGQSGVPGVLLYGMPGGGKTACALELAYGHAHAFDQLIWYKAPDEDADSTGALTDFALALEQYLNGFQIAHAIDDADEMVTLYPQLVEVMSRYRLLIVIDNAESLLAEDGSWHDQRWSAVVAALTAHQGPGKLILTSRRVPAGLTGVRTEAVGALSPDEALLLARELPHLRALSRGEVADIDAAVARRLVRDVLNAGRGHPKLLELAEGQAAAPERLAALIATPTPSGNAPTRPTLISYTCSPPGPRRSAACWQSANGTCSGSCAAWKNPTANATCSTATGPICGRGWGELVGPLRGKWRSRR